MEDHQRQSQRFSVLSDDAWSTDVKFDGDIEYVEEFGGNDSNSSHQTANAAPVEYVSPFGYQVTGFTALMLNVGGMIGAGILESPAGVFQGAGSAGLSLLFWALGFVIAASQLSVYLELASYFPNRSGGQVVYLEQAYPRPRYLIPIAFAVQYMLLSFASSSAVVVAQSLYATAGYTPSAWEQKGLACGCMTVVAITIVFSTRVSLQISNILTIFKLIILIFISITGFVVLGGHTKVPTPSPNFVHSFKGTSNNGYGITNALVRINFAYFGYGNVFNVVNEIKKPIKTLKITGPSSLLIVAILYIFCNIAYFAAIPSHLLKSSKQPTITLFLTSIFPSPHAEKAASLLLALTTFSTIITTLIPTSRILRESFRQGVIPFSTPFITTRPFGTPLNIYTLKYLLTILMILAPPFGDPFALLSDLQSYPGAIFTALTTFGLILIRRRRERMGLSRNRGFRTWGIAIYFSLFFNAFMLATPWIPPRAGASDVSFWYGTSLVVGLGILLLCSIYCLFWMHICPSLFKYVIKNELVEAEDQVVKGHKLCCVKREEIEMWDAEHDVRGKKLDGSAPLGHVLLDQLDYNSLNWTGFKKGG